MRLVESHHFYKGHKEYNSMDKICFLSKNLYNASLYRIKNDYESTGKWLRYNQLEKEFKLSNQRDYRALPNNSSQQVMMLLDTNISSFFKALRAFKKSHTDLDGCPEFPKFKNKKKGRNVVVFTTSQFRVKDNIIKLPKMSELSPIKINIPKGCKVQQLRIVPKNNLYVVEVVYIHNEKSIKSLNLNYLSIDLGLNNLATCISTKGINPLIINGKPLKSINQYYNKKKAKLQSKLGFFVNKKGSKQQYSRSHAITKLTNKRNNKVKDYLHKASKLIIEHCKKNDIHNIVLGKNKGWKQEINIGKKNNQKFFNIPFNTFESYLGYKCQKEGFSFTVREESYTSKASAFDLDFIPTYNTDDVIPKFSGRRIKRGLYKTKSGQLINADVNGAYNILRKEIGDVFIPTNIGLGFNPLKVTPS